LNAPEVGSVLLSKAINHPGAKRILRVVSIGTSEQDRETIPRSSLAKVTVAFDDGRGHPDVVNTLLLESLIISSISSKHDVCLPEGVLANSTFTIIQLTKPKEPVQVEAARFCAALTQSSQHLMQVALHVPTVRVDPDQQLHAALTRDLLNLERANFVLLHPEDSVTHLLFERPV
jgi:hypothetical protein